MVGVTRLFYIYYYLIKHVFLLYYEDAEEHILL